MTKNKKNRSNKGTSAKTQLTLYFRSLSLKSMKREENEGGRREAGEE